MPQSNETIPAETALVRYRLELERAEAEKLAVIYDEKLKAEAKVDEKARQKLEGKLRALNDIITNLQENINIELGKGAERLSASLSKEAADALAKIVSTTEATIAEMAEKLEAGEPLADIDSDRVEKTLLELYTAEQAHGKDTPKDIGRVRAQLIFNVRDVNDQLLQRRNDAIKIPNPDNKPRQSGLN